MAYIDCKIWLFSDDIDNNGKRYKAIKAGHKHYTVKALIDTSSSVNFISKSLADELGEKYGKHQKYKRMKNSLGYIECLELSFRYKENDELVGQVDEALNSFEVIKDPKADLVLGLPWLWLREAEINIQKEGIKIYGDFIPFCKYLPKPKTLSKSESDTSESSPE